MIANTWTFLTCTMCTEWFLVLVDLLVIFLSTSGCISLTPGMELYLENLIDNHKWLAMLTVLRNNEAMQ